MIGVTAWIGLLWLGSARADEVWVAPMSDTAWTLDGWRFDAGRLTLRSPIGDDEATATVEVAPTWTTGAWRLELFALEGAAGLARVAAVEARAPGGAWIELAAARGNVPLPRELPLPASLRGGRVQLRLRLVGPPEERGRLVWEVSRLVMHEVPLELSAPGPATGWGGPIDLAWTWLDAAPPDSLVIEASPAGEDAWQPVVTSPAPSGVAAWTPPAEGAWEVRAIADVAGDLTLARSTDVVFDTSAPEVPTLAPGGVRHPATPTLAWTSVEGASHYDVWVDGARLVEGVAPASGGTTSWTVPASLALSEGVHLWYVEAVDRVGRRAGSATGTLDVDAVAPEAVVLQGPRAGSWVNRKTVVSWRPSPSPDVVATQLLLDDAPCGPPLPPDAVEAVPWALCRPGAGTHRWSVVVLDEAGNASAAPPSWSMNYDLLDPGSLVFWQGPVDASVHRVSLTSNPEADTAEELTPDQQVKIEATGTWCVAPDRCWDADGDPGDGVGIIADCAHGSLVFGSRLPGMVAEPYRCGGVDVVRGVDSGNVVLAINALPEDDPFGVLDVAVQFYAVRWSTDAEGRARPIAYGTPRFSWAPLTDIGSGLAEYRAVVEGEVVCRTPAALSCAPTRPIADGARTFWIEAVDVAGNLRRTPERTLTIDTTPPAPVALVGPVQASCSLANEVTLCWRASTDPAPGVVDAYELVIDDVPQGPIDADGQPEQCATVTLDVGVHTWGVSAIDGVGNHSQLEEVRHVVIGGPVEVCDGFDGDCDGLVPDDERDDDGDGFAACAGDPDDDDATTFPGAPELCDGVDNDGDGQLPPEEADDDLDGVRRCEGDCDDGDDRVAPGRPEVCDGLDDDCDGLVPEDERDADGDGVAPCAGDPDDGDATTWPGAPELCDGVDNDADGVVPDDERDADEDGFRVCDDDCDDDAPSIFPGASEACDGVDGDCDGVVPPAEADADLDGYRGCDGDRDDADPATYPGAPEACDGVDNDGDGVIPGDELDVDADGWPTCAGDPDDDDPTTFPGATEVCDGVDNDGDGAVPADEADADEDGWRACEDDCDDLDPLAFPGAAERCNGLDDDCDGLVPADELDGDGDGVAPCAGDVADDDPSVYPDAVEVCDGVDNDGDGALPEDERDADGDGWMACEGDCADDDPDVRPDAEEVCNGVDDDCNARTPDPCEDTDADTDAPSDDDGAPGCDGCAAGGSGGAPWLVLPLLAWARATRGRPRSR